MNEEDEEDLGHFEKNWPKYAAGAIGVASFTCFMMRGTLLQIGRGIPVTAQGGIPVLGETATIQNIVSGKKNVLNSVSYFSSNRQGPPSWVVRCKETGDLFTSQNSAAITMDLPSSEISRHLNGTLNDVRGFTFERICMAA